VDHQLRIALELTTPGEEVTFEYNKTGWFFKENRLRAFKNITLASELGRGTQRGSDAQS
jgi:hypothetical protein